MSALRPSLRVSSDPALYGGSAYFAIYNAVRNQPGLIHGQLDNERGEHCAVGCYFALSKHTALNTALIDEVAAVNDSMPTLTAKQRKREMLRWLKWKLVNLGFAFSGKRSNKSRTKS